MTLAGCDSGEAEGNDVTQLSNQFNCDVTQISVGGTANGSLATSDCRLASDNSFIDYYALRVTSATSLRVTHSSDDFDAYLLVFNADGSLLGQDDDGGGDLNAALQLNIQPGLYAIGANSFEAGETGAYTLSVTNF